MNLRKLFSWCKRDSKTEYTFSSLEMSFVGDFYEYKIKADSPEEAMKILVRYFYGRPVSLEDFDRVKSSHRVMYHPGKSISESPTNNIMSEKYAVIFRRLITGQWTENDQKWLRTYMLMNNLESR